MDNKYSIHLLHNFHLSVAHPSVSNIMPNGMRCSICLLHKCVIEKFYPSVTHMSHTELHNWHCIACIPARMRWRFSATEILVFDKSHETLNLYTLITLQPQGSEKGMNFCNCGIMVVLLVIHNRVHFVSMNPD